jgi:hypothetical protein
LVDNIQALLEALEDRFTVRHRWWNNLVEVGVLHLIGWLFLPRRLGRLW